MWPGSFYPPICLVKLCGASRPTTSFLRSHQGTHVTLTTWTNSLQAPITAPNAPGASIPTNKTKQCFHRENSPILTKFRKLEPEGLLPRP